MARLSQEKIDQIRGSVDIVDVIGSYIPLERHGKGYWVVCPFHDDTNPSMSVSQELQIYKCFVCQEGGNVFTFLQNYLKISFIEAVKKVAEIGHIDVSELDDFVPIKKENTMTQPLYTMHQEAHDMYSLLLKTQDGKKAYDYLRKRNMSDAIIEKFEIGYASSKHSLYEALNILGYQETDMLKSGLIVESNMHYYDRFSDRIVFPIWDDIGRIVGFSGRVYQNSSQESKYMNSPESDIFIKGNILYHYHQAKAVMRFHDFVYLLEGFMDVIALDSIGIENTVALMGTALTKEHIVMLRKLSNTIHLSLDGDEAGRKATLKIGQQLVDNGFHVRIVLMKDGCDPDEVLQVYSKDELLSILKRNINLIEYKIEYYYSRSNMNNFDERRDYVRKIANDISLLEDQLERNYFIELVSIKSNFKVADIEEIVENLRHQEEHKNKTTIPTKAKTSKLLNKFQKAERSLLHYMLLDKQVCLQYETKLGFMTKEQYRVIANYIVDYYRKHQEIEIANFISNINNQEITKIVLDIYSDNLPKEYNDYAISDYIDTIINYTKKLRKEELVEQLNKEQDPIKQAAIAQKIMELGTV